MQISMNIDDKTLSYLEDLSNMTLSNDEKTYIKDDLQKTLNFMAHICRLETEGVKERVHPFDNVNVFREDEVLSSFPRELILKNAPNKTDEMFIAPKTVE